MKEAGGPYWKSVRCFGIGNMECALLAQPARYRLVDTYLDTSRSYRTKMSPQNHSIAFAESQHHVINSTNLSSARHNRIEHRLHISRRAADDAEHFGSRCLMLQGLAQFRVALLDLLKQPDVFDGDGRLVSKCPEQRY